MYITVLSTLVGLNTKISVARTSSSTDDGFVSCSSPVGNQGVPKRQNGGGECHNLPIIISPHSDLTGDTINLVSHHKSTNSQPPTSTFKPSQISSLPVHSPNLNTSSCSACLSSPPYGNSSTSSASSTSSSALGMSPQPTPYYPTTVAPDINVSPSLRNDINNKFDSTNKPHINSLDINIINDTNSPVVDKSSSKAPLLVDCRESTV